MISREVEKSLNDTTKRGNRNWPIALYLVLTIAINVISWSALLRSGLFPPMMNRVLLVSLFVGQMGFAAIVGGLFGMSWLIGVFVSCLCAANALSMLHHTIYLFPWNESHNFLWLSSIVPLVVISTSVPMLGARCMFGWRLVREPKTFTRRGEIGTEEMLLLTATIASVLLLCQVPVIAMEMRRMEFFMTLRNLSVFLAVFNLAVTLPTVWIAFRTESTSKRWLSLAALGLVASVTLATINGGFSFRRIFYDVGQIVLVGSIGIPAATVLVLGFESLKWSGFQLACYAPRNRDDQSECTVIAPRSGRKIHRLLVSLLLLTAFLAGFMARQLEASRHRADRDHMAFFLDLEKSGGSIDVRHHKVRKIALGPNATDADLERMTANRDIVDLSIANSKISDAGLQLLLGFHKLKSLDVSRMNISHEGFNVLKSLGGLKHLSIAQTGLSSDQIKELLASIKLNSLDIGNLNLDNEFSTLLDKFAVPMRSVYLRGNRDIDDKGLSEFLERSDGCFSDLDLSGTQIDGSCFTSVIYCHTLTLQDVPLTDATFGPAIPNMTVFKYIRLKNTKLTDVFLAKISASTKIQGLDLGDGNFSEQGLPALGTSIGRLSLTGKQFTGNCFANWQPPLQYLGMSGSSVSDESIKHIATLKTVYFLNLSNTQLSDACLPYLAKMQVPIIDLSHTKITASGLKAHSGLHERAIQVAYGQFTLDELQELRKTMTISTESTELDWSTMQR